MAMAMATATSNHLPERHFGYVCCKCKVADFPGRRYACWLCADYQLCGSCYDSGQLPLKPQHTYMHPFDAYYTRAEYELYFGGEPYLADNVPQSYKCAMCDERGLSSTQLYKHLSDVHRNHKDFDEYFSILHSRNAADAFTPPFCRNGASLPRPLLPVASQRSSLVHLPVNFEELRMRNAEARQARNLEQQALVMLEDLGVSDINALQHDRSDGSLQARSLRHNPILPRLRENMRRLDVEEASKRRTERLTTTFANTVRNIHKETGAVAKEKDEDNDKDDVTIKQPDSHKFLCDQFMIPQPAPNAEEQSHKIPSALDRKRFVESLLCSMLSDEQLKPVELQVPVVHMQPKPLRPVKIEPLVVEPKLGSVSSEPKPEKDPIEPSSSTADLSDDMMVRFFRGLDRYHKWRGEFTAKKQETNSTTAEAPSITDFISQTQSQVVPNLGIDSDVDADTDERDEDDDAEDDEVNKLPVEENPGEEVVDVGDEDTEDNEEEEDVDAAFYDTVSGSDTSESTLSMMSLDVDQVYGC